MATYTLVVTTTKKLAPLVSEALLLAGAAALEERRLSRGSAGPRLSRGSAGPQPRLNLVVSAEKRAHLTTIWQRAQQLLEPVWGRAPLPRAQFETDARDSWKTAWMQYLRPVQLTPRLVLAPRSASAEPLARGKRRIVYEPALAFGDGDHPTTRLAARSIERHYRSRPGGALLDIGTGTGVLSFVAVLSGARRATGSDIDRKAVRAATRNARLNALTGQTRFVHSSARLAGPFDLVVINIELRPLLQVLQTLPAAARRAPRLLVTGILSSQLDPVTAALQAAGFRARRLRSEGDWLLLEAKPSNAGRFSAKA